MVSAGYFEDDPRSRKMAIAREVGMGYVDIDRITPEPEAIRSVPLALIQKHPALPLKRVGQRIWIAIDQPYVTLDEIEMVTGLKMMKVLALAVPLDAAIANLESAAS